MMQCSVSKLKNFTYPQPPSDSSEYQFSLLLIVPAHTQRKDGRHSSHRIAPVSSEGDGFDGPEEHFRQSSPGARNRMRVDFRCAGCVNRHVELMNDPDLDCASPGRSAEIECGRSACAPKWVVRTYEEQLRRSTPPRTAVEDRALRILSFQARWKNARKSRQMSLLALAQGLRKYGLLGILRAELFVFVPSFGWH